MSWFSRLLGGRAPVLPPAPVALPAASAGSSLSGRPSYASGLLGNALVPRETTFRLLTQFRRQVPAIKRTTEILSGFAGCPHVECERESDTQYLHEWLEALPYGDGVGYGLHVLLDDLIDQALTYGFTCGEAEPTPLRNGVARAWTYLSPTIGFRTSDTGAVTVVQQTGMGVEKPLNPETLLRVTHDPKGCNPNGESLLLALPAFVDALLTAHHAHLATWRRSGIPIYHIHTELPADLSDPDGGISSAVVAANEAAWNAGMRSQVVDGKAQDFFTANVGNTTVKMIGADGPIMDIDVSNRTLMEQIVSATGIPPFLFGFQWATTERLSQQQADALTATVDCVRREVEGAIRRLIDLHLQLSGRRNVVYDLCWRDILLQDLLATAQASNADAQANLARLRFAFDCWRAGFWNQQQAAEYATGSPDIDTPMDEPPSTQAPQPVQDPTQAARAAEDLSRKLPAEMSGEYGGRGLHTCNGLKCPPRTGSRPKPAPPPGAPGGPGQPAADAPPAKSVEASRAATMAELLDAYDLTRFRRQACVS